MAGHVVGPEGFFFRYQCVWLDVVVVDASVRWWLILIFIAVSRIITIFNTMTTLYVTLTKFILYVTRY